MKQTIHKIYIYNVLLNIEKIFLKTDEYNNFVLPLGEYEDLFFLMLYNSFQIFYVRLKKKTNNNKEILR